MMGIGALWAASPAVAVVVAFILLGVAAIKNRVPLKQIDSTSAAAIIASLSARVDHLEVASAIERAECDRRLTSMNTRLMHVTVACGDLVSVVRASDADHPALTRAETALKQAFQPDLHLPADMVASAARFDRGKA